MDLGIVGFFCLGGKKVPCTKYQELGIAACRPRARDRISAWSAWLGIDGKGYGNATYISEFHPHIPKPWFRKVYGRYTNSLELVEQFLARNFVPACPTHAAFVVLGIRQSDAAAMY